MAANQDERYLKIIEDALSVCAKYHPKFGHGGKRGYSLEEFQSLYAADPFYSWFGLGSPLMYAAHKAAGGMTSVYRQIGIGCQWIVMEILKDHLGISTQDVAWSYVVKAKGGNERKANARRANPHRYRNEYGSKRKSIAVAGNGCRRS